MKNLIITGALFLMVGLASQTATAQQTSAPKTIKQQQIREQQRIHQGVKSGELTKKEAVRLEAQQAKIRQDKRIAKADGVVSPAERTTIKQEQRKASQNIHQQKHDGQTRLH